MKNNYKLRSTFLLALALMVGMLPAIAQQGEGGNVTIEVYKNQDGQMNVESEVRSAEDLGSLENLLRQYGVQEELQDLKPGEEVEVIIRRKQKDAPTRNMVINIDRDFDFPAPPPPPKMEINKRPLLGVYYDEDPATRGGRITSVMSNTGAEAAELQAGDIIIKVDDANINGIKSLQEVIGSHKPGDKVDLVILRSGQEINKEATLGVNNRSGNNYEWRGNLDFDFDNSGKTMRFHRSYDHGQDRDNMDESKKNRPMLGVYLKQTKTIINGEEITNGGGPGIEISGVIPNTAAAEMGLQDGDRITKVNGANVAGQAGISELLKQSKIGDRVEIEYIRNGKTQKGSASLSEWKVNENKNVQVITDHYFESDGDLGEMNKDIEVMEFIEGNGEETVREFRMVVIMEDVTTEEAEALSARSGEEFSGQSDLALESFTVGPNPSTGKFSLSFDISTKGTTELRVLDLNGETVYSENLGNFSGTYNQEFDISNFAKGVYFLQITQNDRAFTKKVVTQ